MNEVSRIEQNLNCVRQQIAEAAHRSRRPASDVRLVAVTKYVSTAIARTLHQAGCHDLGESRPQELWKKAAALSELEVRWHMVGHLQRNKLQRTLPLTTLLHSLDSRRLLEAIPSLPVHAQHRWPILIEVNVSGETAKHGFAPQEVPELVRWADQFPQVTVEGLMCMAGRTGGLAQARTDFARLRELRDQVRREFPDGPPLNELSMGMSADFVVAIEEGATIVRVGSALFEGVTD